MKRLYERIKPFLYVIIAAIFVIISIFWFINIVSVEDVNNTEGMCMYPVLTRTKYEIGFEKRISEYKYGCIYSFYTPNKEGVMKRLIGLPGDHIQIDPNTGDIY